MLLEHFTVAYRFAGVRRSVVFHLYDTVDAMKQGYYALTGTRDDEPVDGYTCAFDYSYDEGIVRPSYSPLSVVMLHMGRLTIEAIAHEMTHAAMHQYFTVTGEDIAVPAGDVMTGASEPTAYFVGGWTARVVEVLQSRGYVIEAS